MKLKLRQKPLGNRGDVTFTLNHVRAIRENLAYLSEIIARLVVSVNSISEKGVTPTMKRVFIEHYGLSGRFCENRYTETASEMNLTEYFTRKFINLVWTSLAKVGVSVTPVMLGKLTFALMIGSELGLNLWSRKEIKKSLGPKDATRIADLILLLPESHALDPARQCSRKVELLMQAASEVTGQRVEVIRSKARPQVLIDTRFALIYILREDFKMVFEDMCGLFAFKFHSTARSAYKKALIYLESQPRFSELIAKIRAKFAELDAL